MSSTIPSDPPIGSNGAVLRLWRIGRWAIALVTVGALAAWQAPRLFVTRDAFAEHLELDGRQNAVLSHVRDDVRANAGQLRAIEKQLDRLEDQSWYTARAMRARVVVYPPERRFP